MICIRNKNVQENVKGRFRIGPFYGVTDNMKEFQEIK